MKKIVFITAVLVLLSACSQKEKQPDITVENRVSFFIDKQAGKPPCDSLRFDLIVTNRSEKSVPNLHLANLRKFAKFLVNGEEARTPSGFGGYDSRNPHIPLSLNLSDCYIDSTRVEDASKQYGNSFTVQWKYMGISSRILEVDTVEKSVEQLEHDK